MQGGNMGRNIAIVFGAELIAAAILIANHWTPQRARTDGQAKSNCEPEDADGQRYRWWQIGMQPLGMGHDGSLSMGLASNAELEGWLRSWEGRSRLFVPVVG
jgi:hypothetical protein